MTETWGLGGDRDWPTSAAFADLDGDGDLDLYVCHYLDWDEAHPRICGSPGGQDGRTYCNPRLFPSRPDHLFRNDGDRFVDATAEAGLVDRDGRGLGVVAADLDDDGRVDLYVANDTTANYLFRNLGGLRFEEIGQPAGVAAGAAGGYQAGMGVACGDLDGDGRLDVAVTNFYGESTTLYRNLGSGLFADHSAASGLAAASRYLLGFGITFLDADADGRLDLATANGHVNDARPAVPYAMPAQLLLGSPAGRLRDVSDSAGPPGASPASGGAWRRATSTTTAASTSCSSPRMARRLTSTTARAAAISSRSASKGRPRAGMPSAPGSPSRPGGARTSPNASEGGATSRRATRASTSASE
ncbi:MAG: VCBS repeat-containing protein, partial [Singulisphaera sp.]